jgi:transposase-like protein
VRISRPLSPYGPWGLGICEGAKEDKSGWSAFLRHLVDRGLSGIRLIISDACRGLVESIAEYLPEARWQRCMVHFYRNVFSHVPSTKGKPPAGAALSWGF